MRKTVVIKVDPKNPDKEKIAQAAGIIRRGGLVAFPTETVYGIAANFLDERAIEKLYEVKERPAGKPFTIHIADVDIIKKSLGCEMTKEAGRLAKKFWPGPLTMVLRSSDGTKLGFRVPANNIALLLIKEAGVPIVAPSANISGKIPPKDAESVLKELDGKIDALLDGGPADIGIESTVIDMTEAPPKILRRGAISEEEILKA